MRHNRRDDGRLSCRKREMKTMNANTALDGHSIVTKMAERGGVPLRNFELFIHLSVTFIVTIESESIFLFTCGWRSNYFYLKSLESLFPVLQGCCQADTEQVNHNHLAIHNVITVFDWTEWVIFSQSLLFMAQAMGAVRITSLNPKFNGSHSDLPPSSIHRLTGWVAISRILWRMRTAPIGKWNII